MPSLLRRRLSLAAAALLVMPLARSQAPARVALLWLGSTDTLVLRNGLLDGLREQGYVAGANIVVDDQTRLTRYEELVDAAAQVVKRRPDLIVSYGATATQAARKATSSIPIVMITGTDPVRLGLVASLSHPGGNVTGVTIMGEHAAAKRIQLLKEAIPGVTRVAIMMNPASEAEMSALRIALHAAQALQLQAQAAEVRAPGDVEEAFARMKLAKVDALVVLGSTMLFANRKRIMALAARERMPAIGQQRELAEAGALFSYGANLPQTFRQAGMTAARILKGASPAATPFEQAQKLDLVVNLRVAKALGLSLPQSFLLRADDVIE